MSKPVISIIGAGKVGTAIAFLAHSKGYPISAIASRNLDSTQKAVDFIKAGLQDTLPLAPSHQGRGKSRNEDFLLRASSNFKDALENSDIVFITTTDNVIAQVCDQISCNVKKGQIIVHCSGALSSEILTSAKAAGALTASLHPLQAIAKAEEAVKLLPGSYFAFEGDLQAREPLKRLVADFGGIFFELQPENKALYHLAAALSCNFLITLASLSINLYETVGMSREQASAALLPLLRGTVNNIEKAGIPQAMIGPIARGEIGVIEKHIEAISKNFPHLLPLYKILGERTIPVALKKGTLKEEDAERLRRLFGGD